MSTKSRSKPRARRACAASKATAPGSEPSGPAMVGMPRRPPQTSKLRRRRRPERIACREHHLVTVPGVVLPQLGNRRGFPDPVDADDHHDFAFGLDQVPRDVQVKSNPAELLPHPVGLELI